VLQERGLALSTSTVALMNFVLLYLVMQRRISGIEGRRTAITVAKILAASVLMGAVCWFTSDRIAAFAGVSSAAKLANVLASISLGGFVFYVAASAFGVPELKVATETIVSRLTRGRSN
jgi:peptidoglycan biosynthesis protein MviN/MurJ (putative lipid II flippase)